MYKITQPPHDRRLSGSAAEREVQLAENEKGNNRQRYPIKKLKTRYAGGAGLPDNFCRG